MNIFDFLIFLCLLWASCKGADDCSELSPSKISISEQNVTEVIQSYTLPDTASLRSFSATSTNVNTTVATSFFNVSTDGNRLTIATTQAFGSFGENVHTDGGISLFVLTITLFCDGTTVDSHVDVQVNDTFSRELVFTNPSGYSYSLPMPIMPKTDISAYGEVISVRDINFSNEGMIFSILPGDFEVTTVQLNERNFKALLSPNRILQFNQSQTYTLTAVDTGGQTQNVEVTIAVNASAGFDSPQFSRSYYSFSYSSAGQLTANDGDIAITSLKPDESSYQLEGDWASSFQVAFDNSSQKFTLSNPTSVPADLPAQILLTLSFTTDVTTETVLIIDVEHLELIPAFSSLLYQGTYDPDSNSISLDPEIILQNAESVILSDEVSERLTIDQDSYAITPISALSIDEFDQYLKLVFTVTAISATQNSSSAVVALSYVKKASLHFDSPLYSAEYSEVGAVTFASASHIGFEETTNFSAVEIAVDAAFSDNFAVTLNGSEWAVTVLKNLTVEILDSQEHLLVPITATMSGLSASALLVLQLPTQRLIQFSRLYYSALYSVKDTGKDSIKLKDLISITGADSEPIVVSFGEYDGYFTFNTETNEVDVDENLDTSPLVTPFIVVLTASITSHPTSTATSLLVVDVETTTSQLEFVQKHYSAQYKSGTVELADKFIRLQNDDNLEVDFAIEDDEYFQLLLDESLSSSYSIKVLKNLTTEQLSSGSLALTITASNDLKKLSTFTVLVLDLPGTDSLQPYFAQKHYTAKYSMDATGKPTVEMDGDSIELNNPENLDLTFSFEGFEDIFDLSLDSATSAYIVTARQNLSADTLNSYSELIMTVTACNSSNQAVADTVLVLSLPAKTSSIQFEKSHYSAEYVRSSDGGSDTISPNDGPISLQLQNANYEDLLFSYEGYEEYLSLVSSEAGSYTIQLLQNLDESEERLIINIMASTTSGDASGSTVLVLNVPAIEKSMKFDQQYYTGSYLDVAEPSIKLDGYISFAAVGYSSLQFYLGDFNHYFELTLLDPEKQSYGILVKTPLEDPVLSLSTELFIVLTAQDTESGDNTSSVLILKLPLYSDEVFDSNHYEAEYIVSADSTDTVRLLSPILVKKSAYTQLTVLEYESYLSGTCDATSLQCAISVDVNLNSSTLVAKELLLTLRASDEDQSSTGKAVLLLQLPAKNASLQFTRQFYSAQYTIEKSAADLGTLVLFENIAVEGSYSDDISITSDLPNYLEFSLVSSTWMVKLLQNFPANILAGNSTLIVGLTAQQGLQTYGTAVLAIQLPDKSAISFSAVSYVAEYVLDEETTPHVEVEPAIKTSQAEYSKIMLNSFGDNFELQLVDSQWIIQTLSPLNSSILSQLSELQLQLTIYKVGVSYGEASLVIKLPSFSFSKDVYSAAYTVDENSIASVSGDAFALANSNPDYIQLNLTEYSEFFYTEAEEETWSLNVKTPLPADITENHRVLVTNLVAQRQSDGVVLATASLVINLPSQDSDEAPKFSNFAYFGEYLSTDPPAVQLRTAIEFANDNIATISNVIFDSYDEYSGNFRLVDEGSNRYSIEVVKALDESVLADNSSIVLTLVATSAQELTSAAALVMALPKLVRNVSVQVENQEVLFNASYKKGSFTSPKIVLHFANDTEDADVSVDITNDMGIDNAYFHYTCSGHVLTIDVDQLPEEVLLRTSMVALKLAITDRKTSDTVYAVLAIDIATEESGGYAGRTALIVAVSLLAVLLLLLLLAVFLYWLCVLRRTKQANLTTEEEIDVTTKTTIFTKREAKKPSSELSQAALRRPTGLPAVLPQQPLDNHAAYADPDPEKKVGFDDNVEKIDTDEDGDEKLRSVADRRPTKFVFGHPLESGVLDPIADIPEERRRSLDLPDDKKKVAFDVENVERMEFEPVEEQDEEEEEKEGTPDSNMFKAEAELNIKADETQLPSQVFKEIF